MADPAEARAAQRARFVRADATLVLWSDDAETFPAELAEFKEQMVSYVWKHSNSLMNKVSPKENRAGRFKKSSNLNTMHTLSLETEAAMNAERLANLANLANLAFWTPARESALYDRCLAAALVGILQYCSGTFLAGAGFFESGIAFFTKIVNFSASISVSTSVSISNGNAALFMGHNAFLRVTPSGGRPNYTKGFLEGVSLSAADELNR